MTKRKYKQRKDAHEQRRLLRWLVDKEAHILEDGSAREQKTLKERGVRTNVKEFYDTPSPTISQRSMHSRLLRDLEGHGFILLPQAARKGERPPPARHVRLTPAGRVEASRRTMEERVQALGQEFEANATAEELAILEAATAAVTAARAMPAHARERFQSYWVAHKQAEELIGDLKRVHGIIHKIAPESPLLPGLQRLLRAHEAVMNGRGSSAEGVEELERLRREAVTLLEGITVEL